MLVSPPTGCAIGPTQVCELDDAFFSSDPFDYFVSRISSLAAGPDPAPYSSEAARAMCSALGRRPEDMPLPSGRAAGLQQVIDAATLRHHIAETLVRTWLAVLESSEVEPGSESVWARLAEGPTSVAATISRIASHPLAHDSQRLLEMLVPPEDRANVQAGSALAKAVDVLIEWFNHAVLMLMRKDIHLAASYNKVKHGLAVRPRDDMRIDFFRSDQVTDSAATLRLSELDSAVPVIDRPSVLYLARPPASPSQKKGGLEITCLRLDLGTILGECLMLATVHAALFHTAARRYQDWRSEEIGIPPYPALPIGPTPQQLLGQSVIGFREPVTFRPDGDSSVRPAGVALADGTFQPLRFDGPGSTVQIVDG